MTQEQSKMIDLDKIYASAVFSNYNKHPEVVAKQAMLEAIRQALELAAENAKVEMLEVGAVSEIQVNKQSIISVNELVK